MTNSLFDELADKIRKDPRLRKGSLARADLGLLLFNARDGLRDLWLAAEAELVIAVQEGRPASAELAAAVDRLRPIFGARP